MRTLALLVALAIAFSGCSEEPTIDAGPDAAGEPTDSNGNATNDQAPTGDPTGNATGNGTSAAPTLSFTSSVAEGQVPFNVTLFVNGTDADGDALAWAVHQDGAQVANGSSVPANLTIQVTQPGNHTFMATLSDGNASVNATLTIVATGSAGYTGPDPLVYAGETTGFDPLAQVDEGCWITYLVAPTGEGFHMGGDRGGWSYALADPSTHFAIFYDSENVAQTGDGTSGQVPAGSHYVDVCATPDGATGASFTLTVYPPGHPDAPV